MGISIKTIIYVRQYCDEFFLEINLSEEFCRKIYDRKFFIENWVAYEIMWKNSVDH